MGKKQETTHLGFGVLCVVFRRLGFRVYSFGSEVQFCLSVLIWAFFSQFGVLPLICVLLGNLGFWDRLGRPILSFGADFRLLHFDLILGLLELICNLVLAFESEIGPLEPLVCLWGQFEL